MLPSPTASPDVPPWKWNPLIISTIGAICSIFLALTCYRILRRHCFGRASFLGHRTERQALNEDNPGDPSLQFHSLRLDSSILYSLPAVQFRKNSSGEVSQGDSDFRKESQGEVSQDESDCLKRSQGEVGQGDADCAVCLGEFEEGEWLRYLPNCTHAFHISCIDAWFQSHSNCPLCRSHVLYNLNDHRSQSVSMFTLLETLRREDTIREERLVHHQVVRSQASQNPINAN